MALTLDYAEMGSRVAAYLLDMIFLLATMGALSLLAALAHLPSAVYVVIVLVLFWGYFPFFEEIWGGQTPGKRIFRLRVIRTDGRPVGLGPVLLRNLLRPIDMLAIGPILVLVTRRRQRLGDMAGGTLVVRRARMAAPAPVYLHYQPNPSLPPLDTAMLNEQEYGLIRSFLERRLQLDAGARMHLGAQLAAMVRSRVPGAEAYGWADEALLEAVLTAVRSRSNELRPPDPAPQGPGAPPGTDPRPAPDP